jgi:hypothetical protein
MNLAGLHERHEGGGISGRPGVRLHVCKSASEKLCNPLDGKVFGNVDELAAAVVAPPGQAFRIFVGEHRALRLQHDVFRRGELDLVALAAKLEADRLGDSARVAVNMFREDKEDGATGFCIGRSTCCSRDGNDQFGIQLDHDGVAKPKTTSASRRQLTSERFDPSVQRGSR